MNDADKDMTHDHISSVVDRLNAFGRRPVAPAVLSAHLRAMAATTPLPRRRTGRRVGVAAGFIIAMIGLSTGLAAAKVDAGPISAAGRGMAGIVGVEINSGTVTHGTVRYYGEDCIPVASGQGAKNRGQYLKWVRENRPEMLDAAKASNCGKPIGSTEPHDDGDKN
ncbi:MAG TPA: hypothetical protein VM282_19815 [Acidimicrobiales bacterium]|nr:hypothetical protein [Acidimicrobiales bacterium]